MKKISILGHLVIVWTLLALLLIGVNVAWGSDYQIPSLYEPEDICQTCRELCPDEPKECRWERRILPIQCGMWWEGNKRVYRGLRQAVAEALVGFEDWEIEAIWWKSTNTEGIIVMRRQVCDGR